MTTIHFLKGLPASGKTTFAKTLPTESNSVRINKDDLRNMLYTSRFSPKLERDIIKIETDMLLHFMSKQKKIVLDNTHFNPVHEQRVKQLINQHHPEYTFNLIPFYTSPEVCIKRDLKRLNSVGSEVIWKMYYDNIDFFLPKYKEIQCNNKQKDHNKKNAIIVDLDGTIALNDHGRDYYNGTREEFLRDSPTFVVDIITSLVTTHSDLQVIFLTGRRSDQYQYSKEWIDKVFKHLPSFDYILYSRNEKDVRKDSIIKEERYQKDIQPYYNVMCVFDDRPSVIKKWRELGLYVLDCNNGYPVVINY